MNKINELKQKITAIEDEAAALDPAKENYYEDLYNLLKVAYFHAKDIIELTSTMNPPVEDNSLEAPLRDAEEQVRILSHFKDGAELEITTLKQTISNISDEATALSHGITDILKLADAK